MALAIFAMRGASMGAAACFVGLAVASPAGGFGPGHPFAGTDAITQLDGDSFEHETQTSTGATVSLSLSLSH